MAVDICHVIIIVIIALVFEPVLCASCYDKPLVNSYCFSYLKDERAEIREVRSLALCHTASRWPSQDLNPGSFCS